MQLTALATAKQSVKRQHCLRWCCVLIFILTAVLSLFRDRLQFYFDKRVDTLSCYQHNRTYRNVITYKPRLLTALALS